MPTAHTIQSHRLASHSDRACRLYVKSLNYPGHLRLLKCSSSNVSGLNYVFFEVCV